MMAKEEAARALALSLMTPSRIFPMMTPREEMDITVEAVTAASPQSVMLGMALLLKIEVVIPNRQKVRNITQNRLDFSPWAVVSPETAPPGVATALGSSPRRSRPRSAGARETAKSTRGRQRTKVSTASNR